MTPPHAAEWTEERVGRFWDWHNAQPHSQNRYFSLMAGRAITNLLTATHLLHGNVLDFGCGTGDLLALLLERSSACHGVDHSPESVARVNQRFQGHPRWRGASPLKGQQTQYPDGSFDLITLIETLEHIPAEQSVPLLAELKRLLKPGGTVFVTTPFAEDLDQEQVYCPFCETAFHRWQHVRSFSVESMGQWLSANGWQSVLCKNIDLNQFESSPSLLPLKYLSPSKTYQWLRFKKCRWLDSLSHAPFLDSREFHYRSTMGDRHHLCTLLKKDQ